MYFIVPKGSFHRKRSPSLSEGGYDRESIIIRNYYLINNCEEVLGVWGLFQKPPKNRLPASLRPCAPALLCPRIPASLHPS